MDRIDEIQPGWDVVTSDGQTLGKVVNFADDQLIVKEKGFFGGEIHVPRDTIAESETGRVEIALTRQQLESGRG